MGRPPWNVAALLFLVALSAPTLARGQQRGPANEMLVVRGRLVGGSDLERSLGGLLFLRGGGDDGLRMSTPRLERDGRFEIVSLPLPSKDLDCTLVLWTQSPNGARRGARVDWKARQGEHEFELGTIELVLPPLLAEGRVLDARGEPLAGASVSVQTLRRGEVGAEGNESDAQFGNGRIDLSTRTDAAGRFEVRGFVDEDEAELRLRADHEALALLDPLVVRTGARGVALRGSAAHRASAALLFDAAIQPHELHARLRRLEDPREELVGSPNAEGALRFGRLRGGAYELVVYASDEREELARSKHELEELVLDLGTIDLRGKLRVFTLSFADDAGHVVTSPTVRALDAAERSTGRDALLGRAQGGRLRLVTARESLDLRIDAPNRRRLVARDVDGDRSFVLLPPFEIAAQLVNRPSWIPGDVEVWIGTSGPDGGSGPCDAGGFARFGVRAPGRYSVTIALMDASTKRTLAFVGAREEWLVLDQNAPQAFTLTLRPEIEERLRMQWKP